MKTFLFAWNPNKWEWSTLEQSISEIESTGRTSEKWSIVSHKKIKTGDRGFLMRLGKEPKGIMASGFISTPPFLSKHWSGEDKLVNRVLIDFEVILNSNIEPLLSLEELNKGVLAKGNWTPQSYGVEISQEITAELESKWFSFLTTQDIRNNPFIQTDQETQKVYTEGSPNQVVVTKYERNPFARKTCIEHYGLSCVVCGFNFKNTYGNLGEDFIHVHHLNQVATIGKEYKIDPIKDLRPVCPNCHAMIHKKKEAYSIDEIKALLQ